MDESGHSVVEARKMYTQQLTETLSPLLYVGLKSIFDSCVKSPMVLKTFQEKLCSVIKWNQEIINKEYKRIVSESECEFLDKIIEAVFISNVQVLSTIRVKNNKSINIKVPETKDFIHKCYIECARYFYQDPSLLDDREINNTIPEIQRNIKRSEVAICSCIEKTIRELIPLEDILNNYLNDNDSESDDDVITPVEENKNDSETESDTESNTGFGGDNETGDIGETGGGETNDIFMNDHSTNTGDNFNRERRNAIVPDLEVSSGNSIEDTPVFDTLRIDTTIPQQRDHSPQRPQRDHSPQRPQRDETDDLPFFSDSD